MAQRTELAYPEGHPKHPDFKGKLVESRTGFEYDYPPKHPARGGQGQPVPMAPFTEHEPHDGHRHLHGLDGHTLQERENSFAQLPAEEQAARMKWNTEGIPAPPAEE